MHVRHDQAKDNINRSIPVVATEVAAVANRSETHANVSTSYMFVDVRSRKIHNLLKCERQSSL